MEIALKVHQVTHLFSPDQLAGASLYTDLARFFRDLGHDVRITTTFPYYPALQFCPEDRGKLVRQEFFEGIPIRRVGQVLPKSHKSWRRLIPEITYLGALTMAGRFPGWKPDVVITACPMLAQVSWQRWLYPFTDVPRLVIVQDSMAHAATELGIIKNRWLGRLLHGFERWSLRKADLLTTISDGMRDRVLDIVDHQRPCVVIPNWIHGSLANLVQERRKAVPPRTSQRLFYSGNFGVKQGLPAFLDQFRSVRGGWLIDLHGGGAEAQALRSKIEGWGDWLHLGGLLDEPDYVDRLLTTTACVVTQMPGVGANFLPSKLLPALAAGTPVLAVCDAASPLGREVTMGQFGEIVEPGNTVQLGAILCRWVENPALLAQAGDNALKWSARYSREKICGDYSATLQRLVECRRQGTPLKI